MRQNRCSFQENYSVSIIFALVFFAWNSLLALKKIKLVTEMKYE